MTEASRLKILQYPYRTFRDLHGGKTALRAAVREPGSALIWIMGSRGNEAHADLLLSRPGGLTLLVVLPPPEIIEAQPEVVNLLHRCRPGGFLPHHHGPEPSDMAHILRRPPTDLAADVTDYLRWRGLVVDQDTAHLIRQIVDLSKNIHTVSGLARGLYMSRRALGRRLTTRGLPVPSHWLHVSRLLRLTFDLQNSDASVFSIACAAGYPDGFSLSNQMYRLTGCRPSIVRERWGWEWVFESWLRMEADTGGLSPSTAREISAGRRTGERPTESSLRPARGRPKQSASDG